MAGFGSRKVSAEIAAGRALRQLLEPGDVVGVGAVHGTLVKVHAVAAEVLTPAGDVRLVPNSQFLDHALSLVRDPSRAAEPSAG